MLNDKSEAIVAFVSLTAFASHLFVIIPGNTTIIKTLVTYHNKNQK